MIDQRGRLLRVALGFAALRDAPRDATLDRLHTWLDSWSGIGHVVAGMARQGYDLELRRYDGQGWRAMFFPSGFEHSLTSHAGSAWATSPWEAVQQAAGDALHKLQAGGPSAARLDDDGRVARMRATLHSAVRRGAGRSVVVGDRALQP